ncbi:MAG: hypothetical protein JWN74_3799 [Acidobacteriaceae bacterium]|nr:hypothetical protein [Acidobacteriaceae bacterium]
MEDQSFENLPLKLAYGFLLSNGFGKEATEIRESKAKLGSYDSTLKRARILAELIRNQLLDQFIAEHWPHGATLEGQKRIRRLNKIYSRYQESIGNETAGSAVEEDEPEKGTAFAYEEHLRDFLAQHLERLEKGLRPWSKGDEDAVEFPVDGRRIDILAEDKGGQPVVIELKVSRGHERTIGQALYYRAKIKEMFKVDRVRIFIVALELTLELRAAAKEVSDVSLFEYAISMTIKPL